jgi:hypothetical protein
MRKFILMVALLAPALAIAQTAPVCDGRIANVRVSEIKQGGTVEGFLAAVKAHKAWFASHGLPSDEIYASRMIVRDEKTHAQSLSDKQFMTFHIYSGAGAGAGPKHDAAYDAFVKLYRENSDIKSEYTVCMPAK